MAADGLITNVGREAAPFIKRGAKAVGGFFSAIGKKVKPTNVESTVAKDVTPIVSATGIRVAPTKVADIVVPKLTKVAIPEVVQPVVKLTEERAINLLNKYKADPNITTNQLNKLQEKLLADLRAEQSAATDALIKQNTARTEAIVNNLRVAKDEFAATTQGKIQAKARKQAEADYKAMIENELKNPTSVPGTTPAVEIPEIVKQATKRNYTPYVAGTTLAAQLAVDKMNADGSGNQIPGYIKTPLDIAGTLSGFYLAGRGIKSGLGREGRNKFAQGSMLDKAKQSVAPIAGAVAIGSMINNLRGSLSNDTQKQLDVDPTLLFATPENPTLESTPSTDEATQKVVDVNDAVKQAQSDAASLITDPTALQQQLDEINSIYDQAIVNIKNSYQPAIDKEQALAKQLKADQEQKALALSQAINAGANSIENANPSTGLPEDLASISGVSPTAVGGADTTYGALLRSLGGVGQASAIADQLQSDASMYEAQNATNQQLAADLAATELDRTGSLLGATNTARQNAIDLAIQQENAKIKSGTQYPGVVLNTPGINPAILTSNTTSLEKIIPGFIDSPQVASTILAQITGAAREGGDYTNPTTALTAWAKLYAKLQQAYPYSNIAALLQAAGLPTDATTMAQYVTRV